jgi:hypothetical protein
MKQALVPDSSAVVVVLDDRWVQDVERDFRQAQAREAIADQIAPRGKRRGHPVFSGRASRPPAALMTGQGLPSPVADPKGAVTITLFFCPDASVN